jgi:hypothetical protein
MAKFDYDSVRYGYDFSRPIDVEAMAAKTARLSRTSKEQLLRIFKKSISEGRPDEVHGMCTSCDPRQITGKFKGTAAYPQPISLVEFAREMGPRYPEGSGQRSACKILVETYGDLGQT